MSTVSLLSIAISGVLYLMIIFLGLLSPIGSSGLPTGRCEQHLLFLSWPCTRWGLHSHIVTYMLVSSYLAFPSLPY
nr:MAG TPA: hypothetical protein [Caudoviricetes sp.]